MPDPQNRFQIHPTGIAPADQAATGSQEKAKRALLHFNTLREICNFIPGCKTSNVDRSWIMGRPRLQVPKPEYSITECLGALNICLALARHHSGAYSRPCFRHHRIHAAEFSLLEAAMPLGAFPMPNPMHPICVSVSPRRRFIDQMKLMGLLLLKVITWIVNSMFWRFKESVHPCGGEDGVGMIAERKTFRILRSAISPEFLLPCAPMLLCWGRPNLPVPEVARKRLALVTRMFECLMRAAGEIASRGCVNQKKGYRKGTDRNPNLRKYGGPNWI
jgi:hypothetical protein